LLHYLPGGGAAISELAVSAFLMPFLPFVNVFLLLVELE
jgi:hypothetical protein